MKLFQHTHCQRWFLFAAWILMAAGCAGNLPGAPLLTPPALRTQIAAQTAQTAGQTQLPVENSEQPPDLESRPTAADSQAETPTLQPTGMPTFEPLPTEGPTPTRTVWWRRTPTPTSTPLPPPAGMFISRPGPFSKVTSPLLVHANTSPGADGLVWVELIGEDGRSLYQSRLNFASYSGRSISIAPEITFELQAPAELARLVISTRDRYGRIAALTSTDLILIQMGDDQIYESGYSREPYIVRAPLDGQIVGGGLVQVSALVRPVNENPLILELLDEQGNVLSSASLDLIFPTGDLSHTPFDVTLAFTVAQPTHARLVLRQESVGRIPGTVALFSLELTLQP